MYYEDGFLYEGKWSNNVKHGEGVLYNNHKALLKGYKKKSKTSLKHEQVWQQVWKKGKLVKKVILQKSSLNQKQNDSQNHSKINARQKSPKISIEKLDG